MTEFALSIGIVIVVAVFFVVAFFAAVTRFYAKSPADRAYVKTGGIKPKVVVNGGDWVIPAFHEITWVDLRTMDIDIERTEASALLTVDPQYADIRAIFYIKVNPIAEDIERAARTIGGGEVNTDSVKRLVESKLEGALRDVAATFTLMSLHQEREKFVERVQNLVRADLAENGLVLESVSITTLKSARQGSFGVDDVFGAQVARANAEVIQKALKERNEIDQQTQTEVARRNATAEQERNDIEQAKLIEIARRNSAAEQERNDIERITQLEVTRRNAQVDEETLALQRSLSQARATQQREIAIREAEERSAAEQATYEQQRAAEMARVVKERAIAEAEQEKEQAVSVAEQRKHQAIDLAAQEREREVKRSEVMRQQAVELADQDRRIALSHQQALQEAAEKERLAIAAEREAAEQGVFTVQETAVAEREARIQIINAERDAQRELIRSKNAVELEAFKRVKDAEAEAEALNRKAEAEATAAIRLAEARRTEAMAATDADKLRADAARAEAAAAGLAEAEVIQAKAVAATHEAEAIRARGLAEAEAIRARGLAEADGQAALAEALAAHDGVAQRLELERMRLHAHTEVSTAQSRSIGEALAAMDFKLYGTPETAQQILNLMSMSDGMGGLLAAAPAPLRELGGRLLERIGPAREPSLAVTNGSAEGSAGAPSLALAQPYLAAAATVLARHLSPAEQASLSLRDGLARALSLADPDERAALLRAEGMLALLPAFADQPVASVISGLQPTV